MRPEQTPLPFVEQAGEQHDRRAQLLRYQVGVGQGPYESGRGHQQASSAAAGEDGGPAGEIAGRVCVLRKSAEAIRLAHQKIRRDAARKGNHVQPATLRFAEYVIVFTTFPEPPFSAADVLEWYRLRWQVELVFKRFKSLAQLGHVPKYDDDSAKAWLYGKLFVALLVEKLIHHARAISPWGYDVPAPAPPERVA